MAKKINSFSALVFSTNPDAMQPEQDLPIETPPADQQKLRVTLDRKKRAGKTVTLIEGFEGSDSDLEVLGKKLKTKCGVGGSAKDGLIIIQGDYKEKIGVWLKEWGYTKTKVI
jgi:translation initiation factor 1